MVGASRWRAAFLVGMVAALEACNPAGPMVLASGFGPTALAVDDTGVYWVNPKAGTVMRVGLDGKGLQTLADSQPGPSSIAIDTINVYWTNTDGGTVATAPKSGGLVTTLASGQTKPVAIAIDSAAVYWTNFGTLDPPSSCGLPPCLHLDGEVVRFDRSNGSLTRIESQQTGPSAIAVMAGAVYWSNLGDETVSIHPVSGPSQALATSQGAVSMALAGNVLYLANGQAHRAGGGARGEIVAVPLSGGDATVLVQELRPAGANSIAVDLKYAYWADRNASILARVPLAGGRYNILADALPGYGAVTGSDLPMGVAIDDQFVYWADPGDETHGAIFKMHK